MRPEDFKRSGSLDGMQPARSKPTDLRPRPANPATPRPAQSPKPPASRPMPMNDFGRPPKPAQKPSQPNPLRQQTYAQPNVEPNSQQPTKRDFTAPKKKSKLKSKKFIVIVLIILVLGGVAGYIFTNKEEPTANTQNTASNVKPFEKPEFATYFPTSLPEGLKITKGSISYYKDSFTFIIEQDGEKRFFVYQQAGSTDPEFKNLKETLTSPKNLSLDLGKGVSGGLDAGQLAAIKTEDGTILIVNDTKGTNAQTPSQIISSMAPADDLESLEQSNN